MQRTESKFKEFINKIKPYIPTYIVAIAIPLIVGILSALITKDNMDIYSELNTPPLAPPSWLFPIAWTLLYILMGISSAMVFLDRDKDFDSARCGLRYYAVSLVLNFGWSIIFFNARAFLFAFVWLLVLLFTIVKTIFCYRKVNPAAAYLQIPYALWVAFAGYLNAGIWLLN